MKPGIIAIIGGLVLICVAGALLLNRSTSPGGSPLEAPVVQTQSARDDGLARKAGQSPHPATPVRPATEPTGTLTTGHPSPDQEKNTPVAAPIAAAGGLGVANVSPAGTKASAPPGIHADVRGTAARSDPASLETTLKLYKECSPADRAAIELEARTNPALRERISALIDERLGSEREADRVLAIRAAVGIRAFDAAGKARMRPLIGDPSAAVAAEAVTYAGWARDAEAFDPVFKALSGAQEGKVAAAAIDCLGSIAPERGGELASVVGPKLADPDPRVREAALKCAFRVKGMVEDPGIRAAIENIARNDDYRIAVNAGEKYPLRDLAREGLAMYQAAQ